MTCPKTVNEVLDWYLANEVREFAPVALKERQRVWKLFRKTYGDLLLADARPHHLLAFITGQRGARSNHTRKRLRATIYRPFNAAADAGLIERNPFRGVKFPDGPEGRDWTDEEYKAVLRCSAPYFRRLVVFVRFCGARPGEGRTLKWPEVCEDVDAIVQRHHKTVHLVREARRIHFNHVLLKLLIWLRRHKTHSTFVFTNAKGRPWTIRALANHLALVRERAGLPKDVKMHGGRHTFATQAIMNGVDIATLSKLLGHKSVRTTERYLHLVHKHQYLNDAANRAIGRRSANG
jgi:integrase